MIEAYGELDFNLDFYTDGGDVTRLADVINQARSRGGRTLPTHSLSYGEPAAPSHVPKRDLGPSWPSIGLSLRHKIRVR